ncbi:MAG: YraN family protein [Phycisphaerales bacterium]|nr:YraN family protein [Phycisphaerales bacterium]
MNWFKRDIGKAGENAACEYLKRQGFRILARNYTCPFGEIDIICHHDACIVFVEVKTLSDDTNAAPEDNITFAKQRQVQRVARAWLAEQREPECAYRFDAVAVVLQPKGKPEVRHIIEAFLPSR